MASSFLYYMTAFIRFKSKVVYPENVGGLNSPDIVNECEA